MKNILNKGQSLWEVIIALAIVSLIAVGLVRTTGFSVKNTRFSTDQSKLTALAQKRIAQIIDQKNANPADFWEDGRYFPSGDFPCAGGSVCIEEDPEEDYCLKINILDSSLEIPTSAPNYESARMATILVKVFWEKGGNINCGENQYRHSLDFQTNITN